MVKKDLTSWYKFEVLESLKHYFFDTAEPEDTKAVVMKRVGALKAEADRRGDRFYTLLFFTLAREGLQKMQYAPVLHKDFLEIIRSFIKAWDRFPSLRKGIVLAELL